MSTWTLALGKCPACSAQLIEIDHEQVCPCCLKRERDRLQKELIREAELEVIRCWRI